MILRDFIIATFILIIVCIFMYIAIHNHMEMTNEFCISNGFDGALGNTIDYCYRNTDGIQERQRFDCDAFSIDSCKIIKYIGKQNGYV